MSTWTRSGAPITTKSFFLSLLLFLAPLWAQASLLAEDTPVISPEEQRFFDRTFLDAQQGDSKAMGTLGLLYEKGKGCRKDLDKALAWFKKGAKKGDAASENNLGFLYFQGIGVGQSDQEAYRWFKKAAEQGLASAEANLGLMYARGSGIPKDHTIAFGWFQKAAEQGDLDAQVNLAQMLSLGQGAPKDYVASYQWFTLALRHQDLEDTRRDELRDDLTWLEKRMTGDQVKQAKTQAQKWLDDHPEQDVGL